MSSAIAADFSHAKETDASGKLLSAETLWRGFVHGGRNWVQVAGMAALPETPAEIEARKLAALDGQRLMLQHLPTWFRLRGLRQKDVAEALGVSEATVSNWIAGRQQMSVGQLKQIANLLKAKEGDLLADPRHQGLSAKVEETLDVMNQLSEAEWEAVLVTARTIAAAKQRA